MNRIEPVTVEIETGKLRGSRSGGISFFKGVPYAAPTGGSNRFMAPQPVANWGGVRDAVAYGDRCSQERETFGDAPILSWYAQNEPYSEDCCVLNVFSPACDSARRPVMVYVHGGGYVTGGGGGATLDGSNLASFGDVVVVTLNHRLNVFGYTNLGYIDSESFCDAANAGQLDIIAALKWVRSNIHTFGGDPGNVTLFGQSGGGSKIMVLMGMPSAKGLFHRAINMSGTTGTTVAPETATREYVDAMLRTMGIGKGNLKELQSVPTEILLQARRAAIRATREGARPVVDGRHVLSSPMSPEGLQVHSHVPLMLGTTATEATFYFASDRRHLELTERQVLDRLMAQFGLDNSKAKALYSEFQKDASDRSPSAVLVALISDTLFRVPMLRAADAKADAGQAPVYLYNFVWTAPVDGGIWGAPHTIDIPFAFGNVDRTTQLTGDVESAAVVSRKLMSAFVAFARTGNPDNPQMPRWSQYDSVRRTSMTIGRECQLVDDYCSGDRLASTRLQLDPYNRAALLTYKD